MAYPTAILSDLLYAYQSENNRKDLDKAACNKKQLRYEMYARLDRACHLLDCAKTKEEAREIVRNFLNYVI